MKRIESPKYFLPLFFMIGILIGLFLILNQSEEDDEFISFDLPKDAQFISWNEGKIIPLSFVQDTTYVLNIFSTWCEACSKEYPLIQDLSTKIPVYGISYNDSDVDLKDFLMSKTNCYKDVFIDRNGESMKFFGTSLIPELLIVSHEKVIYRWTGKVTDKIMHSKILPRIQKAIQKKF